MVAVLMAACVVWLQGMFLLQATSMDIASMLPYGIDDVAACGTPVSVAAPSFCCQWAVVNGMRVNPPLLPP